MDMSFITGGVIKEVGIGIFGIIIAFGYFAKKFSFDKLEISRSDAERQLIEMLRDEVKRGSTELTSLKEKYNLLEDKAKTIANERDEGIRDIEILNDDIKRLNDKIIVLEGIIDRLTDALEITSARLNSDNNNAS